MRYHIQNVLRGDLNVIVNAKLNVDSSSRWYNDCLITRVPPLRWSVRSFDTSLECSLLQIGCAGRPDRSVCLMGVKTSQPSPLLSYHSIHY